MPDGFTVRLSSIADFAAVVGDVVGDYKDLVGQLNAADLAAVDPDFSALLGASTYAGSTALNDAAREMLTAYAALYSKILQTHMMVLSRLEQVLSATNQTHQLYADAEADNGATLRAMLDALPNQIGGSDGTARPW